MEHLRQRVLYSGTQSADDKERAQGIDVVNECYRNEATCGYDGSQGKQPAFPVAFSQETGGYLKECGGAFKTGNDQSHLGKREVESSFPEGKQHGQAIGDAVMVDVKKAATEKYVSFLGLLCCHGTCLLRFAICAPKFWL